MKKYEAYKPSGVDWIGEVPNGWTVQKLLYCLRQAICDGPHETPKQVEEGIPFISIDSLNDTKDIDFSVVSKFISEEDYQNYMKKTKLEKGDILFSKAATIGKTAIVGDEKFMVWSPLAILKNNPQKLNNNFLYHLVNCQRLITSIALSGSYNTQINVGMREMEKATIPVPPLAEQTAIANYLDAKCAKIDNVVAFQQKRIELLKELKQSIITKAVTKGLDKTAKMKDSGIEWIGEVPEGWEIKKIKHLFKIYAGATPKTENDTFWDGDIVWITPADYKTTDKFVIQGERNITQEGYDSCNTQLVPKGSIIFSKRAPIGTVALNGVELCTNQGCLSCVPKKVSSLYYYYVMSICTELFDMLGSGATFKEISADEFANVKLPVPPPDEQISIADYLDNKCAIIERQIAKVEKQIELLNEYKQSVITECVTGKRKVC